MKVVGISNGSKVNFTALRIPKDNAERNLSKLGRKIFEGIDTAGEIVKDTQFYHLYIDREIYIRRIDGTKLNGPYIVQSAGKSIMIGHKCGYQKLNYRLTYDTAKIAEGVKSDIVSSETQIERTAKIVKYIDDYEKKIAETKVIEEINKTDSIDEKIKKLLNKYGV